MDNNENQNNSAINQTVQIEPELSKKEKPTRDQHVSFSNRPELNERDIVERYGNLVSKSDNIFYGTKNYIKKYYKPSPTCMKNFVQDRIPFIKWIRAYKIKESLAKDIIAGLTIGVIQIPQGMAYSLMAGLPPVVGLYVSFWAVIIYAFLGTSRHLSTGTYAITSLMINSCIQKLEGKYYPVAVKTQISHTTQAPHQPYPGYHTFPAYPLYTKQTMPSQLQNETSAFLSNDPTEAKIMIGTALAFYTGILQLILAVLHFGIVTKYLSDITISAFTIAASYHIVATQLTTLLGLSKNVIKTPFTLIEELVDVFAHLAKTNVATMVISIVSMIIIFFVKHFINEKFKEKMVAPVPIDLIVVIFGTLFSYLFQFKQKWHVVVIGEIPIGFPAPKVPPVQILPDIIGNVINISIVSFAINISMAKLFAKKYKYDLDSNQELFAYGIGNVVCGFFTGFPSCVGLSRSVILDSVGAKTQIFGIVSCVVVVIVIVALGPLFKTLPNACLASIIVVALIKMMLEIRVIKGIFKKSKFEALAWIITFAAVMILDIDSGLYVGIAFSILLIIVQSQRASASTLGNIPNTDIYENIDICEDAKEFEGIKIIRYESSIFYANVENFSSKITKLSGVNIDEIKQKINKIKLHYDKLINPSKTSKFKELFRFSSSNEPPAKRSELYAIQLRKEMKEQVDQYIAQIALKHIILDLSSINFIDSMGINAMTQLNDTYKEFGIAIHLVYVKRCIFRAFKKYSFEENFDYSKIYPTIHDAVISILRKKRTITQSSNRRDSSSNISAVESQDSHINDYGPVYKPRGQTKPNIFDEITIKTELSSINDD